jgi:uncharacterized protein YggE
MLLALLGCCLSLPAAALDDPTIAVSGRAEISVRPDLVELSASVESRHRELSIATENNAKKIAGVIEFLAASQIDAKDIRTDFIEIDPISPREAKGYSNPFGGKQQQAADPLTPAGYIVRRGFKIRIRDIKAFEQVYTGLIDRGLNRVGGINFQTSELEKLRISARKAAVKAAKDKAEVLAGELGATLAGVQSIQDTSPGQRFAGNKTAMDRMDPFGQAAGTPPLAVGEIQITASVQVVFRLGATDFE